MSRRERPRQAAGELQLRAQACAVLAAMSRINQLQAKLLQDMTELRDRAVEEGHRIGAYWTGRIVELVDPLKQEVRRLERENAELQRSGDALVFENLRLAVKAGLIADIPATENRSTPPDEVEWLVRVDGAPDPVCTVRGVRWFDAREAAVAVLQVERARIHVTRKP